MINGDVLGNVEGDGGFAHGWTSSEDDEIGGLKARKEVVEFAPASWDAAKGVAIFVGVEVGDALEGLS